MNGLLSERDIIKLRSFEGQPKAQLPKIYTDIVYCHVCGFRMMYKAIRCPGCEVTL